MVTVGTRHEVHECVNPATGGPGMEPRWTRSSKDAVGTAYSSDSRLWFTMSHGILNEVYYPTIDRPQIRDMQLLFTDGETYFHEERRHLEPKIDALTRRSLGFKVESRAPDGQYTLTKEVISDPHQPCLLMDCRVEGPESVLKNLKVYLLIAPHLEVGGWGNFGEVLTISGRRLLVAHRGDTWMAAGADVKMRSGSAGYVGVNDGWTDVRGDLKLNDAHGCAHDGNIALTGELAVGEDGRFEIGLAFGNTLHAAVTSLFQSLGIPFQEHKERFVTQWERAHDGVIDLAPASLDSGRLYQRSVALLLSHEDKIYQGAMVASLSIPWGDAKSDDDLGGYHLVWTRDMVNSAMGLLAAGNTATPLKALIYLAASQQPEGCFAQNFWVDGTPYWTGVQLDEVAFPILLAGRLRQIGALKDFDPYELVIGAAGYLVRHSPYTPQERWEEVAGYSPSTLASNIAALVVAASFAQDRGDRRTATYLREYADFLRDHVMEWTVTSSSDLLDGARHFIRVNPVDTSANPIDESLDGKTLTIANRRPGERSVYPASDIVDAGFLELVRYGIFPADDEVVRNSIAAVDKSLLAMTPAGPVWKRYNHDGYGQQRDGSPFVVFGKGRPWPLLTGERGHYEFAAGGEIDPYIKTMEGFAHAVGLLTEQVWDEADLPGAHMYFGRPTGAAMPLMWAHAEYVKLLRSKRDRRVFDLVPEVERRYPESGSRRAEYEVWKHDRRIGRMPRGRVLRVQATQPFKLRWSDDGWATARDTGSKSLPLGISYIDLKDAGILSGRVQFTFYWSDPGRWEGADYTVLVGDPPSH